MKKKDVLFLCQFFYPEYVSSATLPFDTAVGLAKNGVSVTAMCGYPKEYLDPSKAVPKNEFVDGVNIKRVKYLTTKRTNVCGRLLNFFSLFLSFLFHIFELKNYKAIIVYTNPPILPLIALIAKKIFGTKIILVSYDVYPEIGIKSNITNENSFMCKVMNMINKKVFPNLDCLITVCEDMKDFLCKNRNIDPNKVISIPNWYEDTKSIDNLSHKNIFEQKYEGNTVISYLGNLGTCQDMDTIISTIRLLKNNDKIKFLFAGHGNKMDELKNIVEKEFLTNVDVYGFLRGSDYEDALNISDGAIVSLVPGLSGLCSPSKAYAYMKASIPVIAIMESSETADNIIKYDSGYVIENGNSKEMAEVIIELNNNSEKREFKGKNSRKLFIEKYEKDLCIEKYVKTIRELLNA